jgi:hypothetical protein
MRMKLRAVPRKHPAFLWRMPADVRQYLPNALNRPSFCKEFPS